MSDEPVTDPLLRCECGWHGRLSLFAGKSQVCPDCRRTELMVYASDNPGLTQEAFRKLRNAMMEGG